MPGRPKDWQKIINAQAEVCHWIAPDGTRHPCTPPRHPSPPPSPKHSVVDLTAPPENLELAIAMHFPRQQLSEAPQNSCGFCPS
jgi:hypothetical protein